MAPPPDPDGLFEELDGLMARGMATVVAGYYTELVDSGIPADHALELAKAWQHDYLEALRATDEPSGAGGSTGPP